MQIRPPHPHERRAWRMLLPQAAANVDPCDVLVATAPLPGQQDATPRVVGAIAATRSHVLVPLPGPRVCVHVIDPFRRQGLGRALVAGMAASVQRVGARALYAWFEVDESSSEAMAWRGLGFDHASRLIEHEMPLPPLIERLAPVHEQMLQAGRIPIEASLTGLGQIDTQQREQIVDLYSAQLGGTPAEIRARLSKKTPPHYLDDESVVLLHRNRVIGFLLGVPAADDQSRIVEAVAIDAASRGRWANVWIKLAAARRSMARGISRIRFQTFEHNRETRVFTAKLGATMSGDRVRFYRLVDA